ncbi:hypothetical protein [Ensifer adhaerens]
MYEPYCYGEPPRKLSRGLPIGITLLAIVVIGAYLFVSSALSNDPHQTSAIVLPPTRPNVKIALSFSEGATMRLMHLGRARLGMALPRYRPQLRQAREPCLLDLFEAYALAATTLDDLMQEYPARVELISEYRQVCSDLQAEVVVLLTLTDERLFS